MVAVSVAHIGDQVRETFALGETRIDYERLMSLPDQCKAYLDKEFRGKDLEKTLEMFRGKGKIIDYSMESRDLYEACKLPDEVWRTKSGHCFELSMFLTACLRYLGYEAQYCEAFPLKINGQVSDHACVRIKTGNDYIFIDPGRGIYDAKYGRENLENIKPLSERETVGCHYINCALMVISELSHLKITAYWVKLGLEYYPGSKRAKLVVMADQNIQSSECPLSEGTKPY